MSVLASSLAYVSWANWKGRMGSRELRSEQLASVVTALCIIEQNFVLSS